MNVGGVLASTRKQLESTVDDAGIEAEVLLRHASGMDRVGLYASLNEPIEPPAALQLSALVRRRLGGEPLAYIIGRREFYGFDLQVTPDVLVPRQETESLVDTVIEFIASRTPDGRANIADVGTGSGAIAVALARQLPHATVIATDISAPALSVADANRRLNSVADRVHLVQCDLLRGLDGPFDAIVSNPPYIATSELSGLPADVRSEPARALDGGVDGLKITERLVRQSLGRLTPSGGLFVEIAPEQAEPIAVLVRRWMQGFRISIINDLSGSPRVAAIQSDRPGRFAALW
ncbi:MAG: peptide chain release factor N(5)-glutamine methyltransferase [Chloroflexi bacterium]|nr:peptide chain release factor N(5)-glutamine methyltransferase [Chloroflexota bacterium]